MNISNSPYGYLREYSSNGWGLAIGYTGLILIGGTRFGKVAAALGGVAVIMQLTAWLNQSSPTGRKLEGYGYASVGINDKAALKILRDPKASKKEKTQAAQQLYMTAGGTWGSPQGGK